jgi:uncharacterized protein YfdQ (DUF2303 family)
MSEENEKVTEYEAAFRHGVRAAVDRGLEDDGRDVVLVPEGMRLESLERFDREPDRIRSHVRMPDLESFNDYLVRFGDKERTVVFADLAAQKFRACLDYHQVEGPSWCEHLADLELAYSEEWLAWTGIHGKMLPHVDFAEFLEERAPDIVEPDAASVLEVAQGLQVDGSAKVVSVQSLSGAKRIAFEESETVRSAREGVEAPERLELHIPVFDRFDVQSVNVRLVYRAKNRQLMVGLRIPDRIGIVRSLFDDILGAVREGGWPVFLGQSSGAK